MLDSRAVRTLSRYFIARYLGLFAAILVGSTLTVAIVEMLLNYDEILEAESSLKGMMSYVFLRIPSYYLGDLIPIAGFAAGFFSLGLASRWLEITAIKSGGISPRRTALPLLATAGLLALCTYALNETLVARATRGWSQQQGTDGEFVFRQGAFWYHKGRSIYNISSADPQTLTLRGVEVFQRTQRGRLEVHIQADLVRVGSDGTWHLENATVRRFDPDHPEGPTRVESGVALDLPVSQDRDLLLRQVDAAGLPLLELAGYLELHRNDDYPGSRANRQRLRTLLHQRLCEPLLVVLFTLLAIPLALRVEPGGSLGPLSLQAVATLGVFFLLRGVVGSLAIEGIVPGAISAWAVLGCFALWGGVGLLRAAR